MARGPVAHACSNAVITITLVLVVVLPAPAAAQMNLADCTVEPYLTCTSSVLIPISPTPAPVRSVCLPSIVTGDIS
jgi:hypothetical protein